MKELRGGSNNGNRNSLSMVVTSIKNAATHGINLQHGAPNRADGDCIFESVMDNVSSRSCFEEVLHGQSEHYRKKWLGEAEEAVFRFTGGLGRPEIQF